MLIMSFISAKEQKKAEARKWSLWIVLCQEIYTVEKLMPEDLCCPSFKKFLPFVLLASSFIIQQYKSC